MSNQPVPTLRHDAFLPKKLFSVSYDFTLEWRPEDMNDVESGGPFRAALKEQLGLKVEPQIGPVRILVIDHVEFPSPN